MAFANIEIPLQLGKIINELTKFTTSQAAEGGREFWSSMKEPACKLLITYAVQVTEQIVANCTLLTYEKRNPLAAKQTVKSLELSFFLAKNDKISLYPCK